MYFADSVVLHSFSFIYFELLHIHFILHFLIDIVGGFNLDYITFKRWNKTLILWSWDLRTALSEFLLYFEQLIWIREIFWKAIFSPLKLLKQRQMFPHLIVWMSFFLKGLGKYSVIPFQLISYRLREMTSSHEICPSQWM